MLCLMPQDGIGGPSAGHAANDVLNIINKNLHDRMKAFNCVVRTPLDFPVAALHNALQTVERIVTTCCTVQI